MRKRNSTRAAGTAGFAAMLVVIAGGAMLRPEAATLPQAVVIDGTVLVLDGDTLEIAGERIRLADIDAPELFSPKCDTERALAERAKLRLAALVGEGVTLSGDEVDLYGRQLRIVMRDGESVGAVLVGEGLAREWDGKRRGWC